MTSIFARVASKSYSNSSRIHLARFAQEAGESVPPNALVLDAGAGEGYYRQYFSHSRYESADFCQVAKKYAQIDYVCDLAQIPVEGERYDLVFLTQVLEHLPDPAVVLRELHRVLKGGGRLWISTPLYYPEHEVPFDFYRYTQFGLRHVLEGAGFEVVEMRWLEGYLGTLSYQLWRAGLLLPIAPHAYGAGIMGFLASGLALPIKFAMLALASLYSRCDSSFRFTDVGHPKNYCVIAQKR